MPYNGYAAGNYAQLHARSISIGRCAEFVRLAIENGGGVSIERTPSAKDMGRALQRAGFREAHGTPLAGDVIVIQAAPGHPHGHAAIYDGQTWISDFRQRHGFYPGPAYREARPSYKLYRHH
jgi:hypothetical protein